MLRKALLACLVLLPFSGSAAPDDAEARARARVARMTPAEKIAQLQNAAPAIPRLGVPAYNWWNEGAARLRARRLRDRVSASDRAGGELESGIAAAGRRSRLHRGARQVQRARRGRASLHVPGTDVLVAQHQHLPRSALGPGPGNLRRGSVSHRAARRGLRPRRAGRRPRASARDRHAQAFRGAQRTGTRSRRLRCARLRARPGRHLPAGVPRGGDGRPRRFGDVFVQRRGWRAGMRGRRLADQAAARRLGFPRLRGVRLRRGGRHRGVPSLCAGRRARGGRRAARRHRPGLRQRLCRVGRGAARGLRGRSANRCGNDASVRGARTSRHPRRRRPLRGNRRRPDRQPRTPCVGAGRGAAIDRAAEERARDAAIARGAASRRDRSQRRHAGNAGSQLPWHRFRAGHAAARLAAALRRGPRDLRAGRAGRGRRADSGTGNRVAFRRPSRIAGRIFFRRRFRRQAETRAHRPHHRFRLEPRGAGSRHRCGGLRGTLDRRTGPAGRGRLHVVRARRPLLRLPRA